MGERRRNRGVINGEAAEWGWLVTWAVSGSAAPDRFFFFLYLHHISLTQSQWQQQLFVHNTPALCAGSRLVSNRGSSKEKKPLRVAIFQSQTHNFVFVLIKSNSMNSGPGAQTMSGLVSDGGTVDLWSTTCKVDGNLIFFLFYAWEATAHFPHANESCKQKKGEGWKCCVENVVWLAQRLAQSPSVFHCRERGSEP